MPHGAAKKIQKKIFNQEANLKTLESPLDCKEINPEYSLEGWMLKLQYIGHLMQKANSLEKTLMLGKRLKAKGEVGSRGFDG